MTSRSTGWRREFDHQIALPNGRKLVTLLDAATYATELSKKETVTPEWQAAIEALILVVDLGGPTMFARIGMMRALNGGRSAVSATPSHRKNAARRYRIVR